jgi:hypothetical protein
MSQQPSNSGLISNGRRSSQMEQRTPRNATRSSLALSKDGHCQLIQSMTTLKRRLSFPHRVALMLRPGSLVPRLGHVETGRRSVKTLTLV